MSALNDISLVLAAGPWRHDGLWWFPFGLLWTVLIAAAVVLVVRSGAGREHGGEWSEGSAQAILAERFARGEISEEEYRERLDALRSYR